MATVKLDIADKAAPAEKTQAERIADKLRQDYRSALSGLTETILSSSNLLWGKPDNRRTEEEVNEILSFLGQDAPVIFARHKAAIEWLEQIGAAEFEEQEKAPPMVTEFVDGRLVATPRAEA